MSNGRLRQIDILVTDRGDGCAGGRVGALDEERVGASACADTAERILACHQRDVVAVDVGDQSRRGVRRRMRVCGIAEITGIENVFAGSQRDIGASRQRIEDIQVAIGLVDIDAAVSDGAEVAADDVDMQRRSRFARCRRRWPRRSTQATRLMLLA